jgi:hypothetical protein
MFHNKTKGSACDVCGSKLRQDFPRIPACGRCVAKPPVVCAHLGEATGANELIQCHTCQGNVRLKFPTHNCAVHSECLPTYTGSDAKRMACRKCRSEKLGFKPKEVT